MPQPTIEDRDLFKLLANLIRVHLGRGHLLPVNAESEFKFKALVRPQEADQSNEQCRRYLNPALKVCQREAIQFLELSVLPKIEYFGSLWAHAESFLFFRVS